MILEIILGVFVILEGYVIWNLFRKTEFLEMWVERFTQDIQIVQDELKKIDSTGHFEADDEVGTVFKLIKNTVQELKTLKGEPVNAK
jgi:HAMP domain-containing protein